MGPFPMAQWIKKPLQCIRCRRHKFHPWVGTIPRRRKEQPTPVFLPAEFHGQRILAAYGPYGRRVRGDRACTLFTVIISIGHIPCALQYFLVA